MLLDAIAVKIRVYWRADKPAARYASGQPILNLVSGLSKIVCT